MANSIYGRLKEVVKLGINEKKLFYYKAMTGTYLEEDLNYQNYEEGLVSYFCNLEEMENNLYGSVDSKTIKQKLGISNIYEERDFFAKLFMRDYESRYLESYKLKDDIDVREIFKHFASDELKSDPDFAMTISTLDGKYLQAMSEEVRSNPKIVYNAICNDTSKDVDSFLSASNEALENSELAYFYFSKKKENNSYLSATETYEKIFKKDNDGNFVGDIFKGNVQNYWLSDNNFLAGLAKLNVDFVPYILDGKITISTAPVKKVK